MSQEITIIVVVDTVGAINSNKLEGNIYLIDNLRSVGSTGCGTGHLVTAINGSHWQNGTMASEPLLNWLIVGTGSLPPSLPRNFSVRQTQTSESKRFQKMMEASRQLTRMKREQDTDSSESVETQLKAMSDAGSKTGYWAKIRSNRGELKDLGLKLMSMKGDVVDADQDDSRQKKDKLDLSQLAPILTDITGEAVDEGILYPAQYGTPITLNDGWYWSATASTHKPGVYSYTMHLRLHQLAWSHKGEPIWETKDMTYASKIKVESGQMVNGFTGGATGYIPVR